MQNHEITAPMNTPAPLLTRNSHTIAHLRALARGAMLQHYLKIGDYLLDQYFDGDAQLYGDNRRNKEVGFDALLADHMQDLDDMGLKATVLRNCIRAFIVWRGLAEDVRKDLDFSDLYALAPVANLTERAKLAQDAVQGAWNNRQVMQAVQAHHQAERRGKKKLGRPTQPMTVKHVAEFMRAAKHLPAQAAHLHPLSVDQREQLRSDVEAVRKKLAKIDAMLDSLAAVKPAS